MILRPFGLNEVVITDDAGLGGIALDAARTMNFTPRMLTGELTGNDKLASVASVIEALEWSLEEGGIPIDALALMIGFTPTVSGSTPNRVTTLAVSAATRMPWFRIYGLSLGEGDDNVHVVIWKAKITGNIEGQFAYGEFFVSSMSGLAVEEATNGLYDIVHYETAAPLPVP